MKDREGAAPIGAVEIGGAKTRRKPGLGFYGDDALQRFTAVP